VNTRMRFGCPRVAARHKRAYLDKENSFAEHKNVAGDTRQGWCSAAGSDWANHKAEVRSITRMSRFASRGTRNTLEVERQKAKAPDEAIPKRGR
jgi:hypothetical protein